jgi:NADH-quinone oxidoreductase subunit M
MIETDALIMTLCIFIPSAFALALMFFPKGSEEYMRWFTLLGTAVTMVVSIILFIDYLAMLDHHISEPEQTTLAARAEAATNSGAPKFDPRKSNDMLARYEWIPVFNIEYYLGVDGISMPLILLTTLLFFVSMMASWPISKYVRGYCMLFLILETGVLGTFFALDFFLFYIFWEVMLLPMYFLIGVWGGPRREYAAIKFFLYTLLGSVFILIAMLGFYFTDVRDFVPKATAEKAVQDLKARGVKPAEAEAQAEVHTFDLVVLARVGRTALEILNKGDTKIVAERLAKESGETSPSPAKVLEIEKRLTDQTFFTKTFMWTMFVLLFVGFAIKVPVFPFHTWLPDAHVEAPTPISMILAGILLKLGGYGILRIAYPVCPWAAQSLAEFVVLLGMINIVYGAFAAMAQTDFKKLVAYSSISHMGYVIVGIAVWSASGSYWSWGINGAMYQMIGHGISSAGMFFLVGVIYDRAHHRNLDNFRGLYEPMPLYGGVSAVIFFAALGLPGLCGFVGEFMVVLGLWNFSQVYAILAALTVVITAAYILWTIQRVYFGTNPVYKDYKDMDLREILCITPLLILAVALGIWPQMVLSWVQPHMTGLIDSFLAMR